jgi:pyrophosphatase PpaX
MNRLTLLFDLDGTLVDTKELILVSYREATRKVLGQSLPDDDILPLIGMPLADQMRILAPEHVDELTAVYRKHNKRVHDEFIRPFEGIREVLAMLRAGGRQLAVVTSKRKKPALRGLAAFDLAGYFDLVIGSDDTERHKPDPEPLLVAAARLGVPIEDCAYIGDSPYDMRAARAANATAIAALWGMFDRASLQEAGAQHEAYYVTFLPRLLRKIEKARQ